VTVATAGVDANGNPYATSTSLALFKGVNGGIDLATGGVTSGSAGSLAPVVAAAPDLPRTGGNSNIAIAGGGLLALAVLVRRVLIGRR
jgi:LPXTG-motif cell wall-anchored protein